MNALLAMTFPEFMQSLDYVAIGLALVALCLVPFRK